MADTSGELPRYEAHRRHLTLPADDLERIRAAYTGGMSLRAIASDTGRSYGWVHRTLTEAGVDMRPRGGRGLSPFGGLTV